MKTSTLIGLVTLAHFALLFCFNLKTHSTPKKPLVIRTLTPSPKLVPVPVSVPVPLPDSPPSPSPMPMPLPSTKSISNKPTPKPASKPTPKPTPKPAQKSGKGMGTGTGKEVNAQLLNLMKEGISKMDKASSSLKAPKTSSHSTSKIGKLKSESLETSTLETNYIEEIALYLKHQLHFPDEGTMKITLTLSCEGIVKSFKILQSSSTQNQTIAQKALSSLSFPSFKNKFSDKSKSFTILVNIDPY